MNAPRLLAAVGAGNTTALILVVGRGVLSRDSSTVLPVDLLVDSVLPIGLLAGLVILVGARRSLASVDDRLVRPIAGAYAAPGYAVPVVVAVRHVSADVFTPPTAFEVAIVCVTSAAAAYVLAWFAEGPPPRDG